MSVMTVATMLVLVALCGLGVSWGLRAFGRRLPDPAIAGLIEGNRAQYRERMSGVDWDIVRRAGDRRYQEVMRAQRNGSMGLGQ